MPIVFLNASKPRKDIVSISDEAKASARLSVLLSLLKKADEAYYNSDKPIMSDSKYDAFREEAEALYNKLKGRLTPKSLLKAKNYFKRVGAPVRQSKRSVELPHQLGSLKKVKSDDDKRLLRFIADCQEATREFGQKLAKKNNAQSKFYSRGIVSILTSPKLDGLTLLLHYHKGKLVDAFTRGDGKKAQSKLKHAHALAARGKLPLTVPKKAFHKFAAPDLFVKCELVCRVKDFKDKWQGKGYSNARNAASGWLNSDKPEHSIHKILDVVAYDVYTKHGELGIEVELDNLPAGPTADKLHTLTCLSTAGFLTYHKIGFFSVSSFTGKPTEDWIASLKKMLTQLDSTPYQLDGIVVELSSNHVRQIMGTKDGRPRFAIAYKTSADDLDNNEGADSTITKIEYNTSKVGALKPTIWYKPVQVMDSTLTKATGNNVAYLIREGLGVGAKVRVVKAGGIIPKVHLKGEKVKKDKIVPTHCECGAPAVEVKMKGKTLPDWYCSKPHKCKAVQSQLLALALKRLKIVGISGKTITKLNEAGYNNISDLLQAKSKQIMKIPGFGVAAAASLTKGLQGAISNSSVATLMEVSGVFMQPGLALASESFSKLEKVLGKQMKLDKNKVTKAIGPAKGQLFIDKYPAWVAYRDEHLSEFV